MAKQDPISVGIVGAGRTRGGLGPFLAGFLEQEGFVVAGVSGRSRDRAKANAQSLALELGHEVAPFASPNELCASGVEALVISSPSEFHLEALQAAADAGLPTLCEKPLVHEHHRKEGAQVIETFARNRVPLVENCQWPYVLPALFQLHGPVINSQRLNIEMGLGPRRSGREMVQNTLSHLLSVIQSVVVVNSNPVITDVRVADPSYQQTQNLLQFRLVDSQTTVEASLYLTICDAPVRPAWLSINGRRIDRQIGQEYSMTFSANGAEVSIEDPVKQVVANFALIARTRDRVMMDDAFHRIRQRLHWYHQILGKLE